MYSKLVFYNNWGVGDLFESREFIKECMNLVSASKYYYAHTKSPRMFADIENLNYGHIEEIMTMRKSYVIDNNCLYWNTWIGQNGLKYGCTVESIYEMFNDILIELGMEKLHGVPLDYLPEIDYTKFEIDNCNKFIYEHPEEKILVCNGNVFSGQAVNFDFSTSISLLATRYPQKTFLLTKKISLNCKNVFFTDDITKTSDKFDINEISYLSTFCKILIGRYSGPHTCAQVKQNWFDPTKKLVTFTHRRPGCSFTDSPEVRMRQFWSNEIHPIRITKFIESVIESG